MLRASYGKFFGHIRLLGTLGEFRNFNINTELKVMKGSSNPATTTSFLSMDSTDGSIDTKYNLAWKQC